MGANNEAEIRKNFQESLSIIKKINHYLDNLDEELQYY
jgi:hypothetical protein